MAYVPVPKDLTKVKTKVAFNLTKRQLICFGGGALLGVPLFFLLRGSAGNSTAALCMMFVMLPFFLLAMYEKHGQPLEKIVGNIIRVTVIRPRQRPYRTNNFYAVLQRQANLDEEVSHIVYGNQKLAAPAVRKKRGKSCPAPTESRLKLPLPAPTARTKRKNPRRTVSLMNGCGRMVSAGYQTVTTQKPFNFRTSTISFHRTRIKPRSSRAGAISSTTSTARFSLSCLF